uniref:Telomerase-binding protein EST1A n=1 Tax=Oncorhynchus mykiss TaxID=8022 RepID=A0A8K9XQN5_ONCMY
MRIEGMEMRIDGVEMRGGSGNEDRGSGNEDRGSGNEDRGSGNEDRGSGNEDRGSGNEDRGSGNEDRGSGNEDRGSGNEDRGSGNEDRGSGNEDKGSGHGDRGRKREGEGALTFRTDCVSLLKSQSSQLISPILLSLSHLYFFPNTFSPFRTPLSITEERGEEGRGQRQQRHHGNDPSKRPDLQRYTPGAGHGNPRRDRLGHRERDGGEGGGGQLPNRRRNTRDSSTDSLEERRRDGGEEYLSPPWRRGEEESRGGRGHRGGGRGGLLKVSQSDRQSGTSHATSGPSDDPQGRLRQGTVPRGKERGILILPAHTDLSNSPTEPGPRLLFGGIRGGKEAGLGRGGRGGGTRRLWDPNNPDQKPALRLSQHTGGGYGALHFLDTDDEAAGSPPVRQGEHFHPQQEAAAMAQAFYKYQNSDNPYPYNANPNARYPYPYHTMPTTPYQMPSSNGIYPAQFYGEYRGQGYQTGAGAGLTPEEVEQQARGELGRQLRAADSQELQLSNLLSRDRLSADGLDRMAQLRADLLTLYERVILTDIEFSDSQNLDQALWKNVFYQVIEHFRQLLKDPSGDSTLRITPMLLTLLDEGTAFFDALLQKLQTVFQFKLEDYMDGMAIRPRPLRKTVKYALISAQRCLICQGDIARYREQASDSANYGKARSWYLKAQQIAPKNGRPYNQLALLAVYTKRKLDAVYYYMRSLAASNPILTAKESLMSLFEEAKRKADQMERRRKQEWEGGSRGPGVRGGGRGEEGARVEIWVGPIGQAGVPSSHRGGSESSRDSEQEGELGNLSPSDVSRTLYTDTHTHTTHTHHTHTTHTPSIMESFPSVASRVLQEFTVLLQHSPSPLGSTRMLQIITINMFTIHNAQSRGGDSEVRSVLQEQTTALGLAMFSLLVQRCTELLRDTPAAEEREEGQEGMVRVSAFPLDLRELLPSVKVWSDWMLGHPNQWNPPPCRIDLDVWRSLADLCNALARVDHGEAPLYKADGDGGEGDEELRLLLLEEDRLLAGFVPLLAAPQEPCYVDCTGDTAIAADCKRVTVLKYFLEALCGQEEPLLAFKGGKYVSMATSPQPGRPGDARSRQDSQTERESDDVIVEAESSVSDGDDGSEDDIRELRARRSALTNKLAEQQRRRDKIQAVLQTCGQLELEVRPLFLVPDTNGFIDHLTGLKTLLQSGTYIVVVPLIVITELDGLAKGGCRGNTGGGGGGPTHARSVQEKAKVAVAFLERGFEAREPCLRALTSRGSQLESIAFRSEDTSGQQGNNDDVILSCCLHYCKDEAKSLMPAQTNGPVRLRREVVLLTDDRNLRVKALTRNVPVRDIPAFLTWAKVG